MPPLMIIMVGLPGSGKTTVADELHRLMVAAGCECTILSSDSHIERVAVELGRSYQDVFQELELTRFRGHLTLWGGGIHDAENETAVSAGLPASDD